MNLINTTDHVYMANNTMSSRNITMSDYMNILLKSQGSPGKYLLLIYALIYLNYFPIAFNNLSMFFVNAKFPFKCGSSANETATNVTFEWNKCLGNDSVSDETSKCLDDWIYRRDPPATSIVTEWDLVCERSYLVELSTSIYFFGVLLGGIISGHLADHMGRKSVMIASLILNAPIGAACAFMPTYSAYAVFKLLQGICTQAIQTTSYILLMEISLVEHRSHVNSVFTVMWTLGLLSLTGFAYFVRHWRYLQLMLSVPTLVALTYIWFLPESPRFLLQKNKKDKVERLFLTMSKVNRKPLNHSIVLDLFSEFESLKSANFRRYTIFDIIRTPTLRFWSLILSIIWMTPSFVYYGITFSIADMAGDKYINFAISASIDIPGYLSPILVAHRFGRRRLLTFFFAMSGICCIAAGILLQAQNKSINILSTAVAFIGKMCGCATFTIIVTFTSEIYPTILRNTGFGLGACLLRIGSMLAPQILLLGQYKLWIPSLLLGCTALVSSAIVNFLPETANTRLPDTIKQAQVRKRCLLGPSIENETHALDVDHNFHA